MADQRSLTALQPFLALAKNAGPAAAADIITRATEASDCYVFAELLEMPSIQALAGHETYGKYHRLLLIFAYGSYPDYITHLTTHPSSLPPLTPPQEHKLKQLSLITLSSQNTPHSLSYTTLLSTLHIPTTRALEDLVISAIYASLLDAKLDTAAQRIEVSSTAGRDVAPGEIPAIIGTLENWCRQCEGVLKDIEEQVAEVQRLAWVKRREAEEYERAVAAKRDLFSKVGSGGGRDNIMIGESTLGGGGGGGSGTTGGGKGKRVISDQDDGHHGGGGGYDEDMDIDEGGTGDSQMWASQGGGGSQSQGSSQAGRKRKGPKIAQNKSSRR